MKIVLTDCDHGYTTPEETVIRAAGHDLQIALCSTTEEVYGVAHDAHAIICQYVPITSELLASLPLCRVVGRYGVGVDNVDVAAATRLGIKVVHTPYFCFQEVAGHTMALILALSRQIVQLNQSLKQDPRRFVDDWNKRTKLLENAERPAKQTIGIVGFGKVGRTVAQWARDMGYKVVAWDSYVPEEVIAAQGIKKCSLEEILRTVDFLSLHLPTTSDTRGLIGAPQLGLMKSSAYLINTSRGTLVDEKALLLALEEGRLAGAALDVLDSEPFPADHPFLKMENVILTPHVAYYSRTSIDDLKVKIAQYVVNALSGSGEYYIANPEVQ